MLLLLLHGARRVWAAQAAGGLAGRDAARPQSGQAPVLEVALEALVQPQQAGQVSGREGGALTSGAQ